MAQWRGGANNRNCKYNLGTKRDRPSVPALRFYLPPSKVVSQVATDSVPISRELKLAHGAACCQRRPPLAKVIQACRNSRVHLKGIDQSFLHESKNRMFLLASIFGLQLLSEC